MTKKLSKLERRIQRLENTQCDCNKYYTASEVEQLTRDTRAHILQIVNDRSGLTWLCRGFPSPLILMKVINVDSLVEGSMNNMFHLHITFMKLSCPYQYSIVLQRDIKIALYHSCLHRKLLLPFDTLHSCFKYEPKLWRVLSSINLLILRITPTRQSLVDILLSRDSPPQRLLPSYTLLYFKHTMSISNQAGESNNESRE